MNSVDRPVSPPSSSRLTSANAVGKRLRTRMESSRRSSTSLSLTEAPLPSSDGTSSQIRPRLVLPPLHPSIRSSNQQYNMSPPRSHRREFDYRRPASSSTGNLQNQSRVNVVDLTSDDAQHPSEETLEDEMSRVHNFNRATFPRDFIDLSDSSPPTAPRVLSRRRTPWSDSRVTPTLRRESSSDVTFVNQRRREENRNMPHVQDPPTPSPPRRRPVQHNVLDLTGVPDGEPEEDVIFVSERPNPRPLVPQSPTESWPDSNMSMTSLAHIRRLIVNAASTNGPFGNLLRDFNMSAQTLLPERRRAYVAPEMNYADAGFDMRIDRDTVRDAARERYQAPPDPDAGFTRTPHGQEVVCPNCGDELVTGDDDEKRQVWAVKNCGHVYCGRCMANRAKSKRAKGRGRAQPEAIISTTKTFSECVVQGCKSSVKNKSNVVQVFL